MRSLVVKMSALGDIIQAFSVLSHLKSLGPVDWVVEAKFADLVCAHPLIDRVIPFDTKNPRTWDIKYLRKMRYDTVYDLQGNCKSGLFTLLARGKKKVGFTLAHNAEWPNRLALSHGIPIYPGDPIRNQYRTIVGATHSEPVPLIAQEVQSFEKPTLMVCTGSNWKSKRLLQDEWISLLKPIKNYQFLFVWKSCEEKVLAESLQQALGGLIQGGLSLPQWQALMRVCKGVISVDSCALHLATDGGVPAFGLFGPSSGAIYGSADAFIQGECPLDEHFLKRCPHLRTCKAPCMRNLPSNRLNQWVDALT